MLGIQITTSSRKEAKASRQRYQIDLEEKSKSKSTNQKSLKRKSLEEDIQDTVKRQKLLEDNDKGLSLDADKGLSLDADKYGLKHKINVITNV